MKKERQNKKQNLTNYKGITLIALVVTIIVLLILAGVSITAVLGGDGLINKAKIAGQKTNEAIKNDMDAIEEYEQELQNLINGMGQDSEEEPPTPPAPGKTRIEELMETAATDNETVYDKYGNKIRIPAGFKIVPHGTKENNNNMVEYKYDRDGGVSTNTPVVQDGIVIKNETDGNEFVWVPVGEIKNHVAGINKTTITLGRYEDFTVAEDGTLPTPAQVASKTAYDTPIPIDTYHFEISSNFAGGTFERKTYNAASNYGNTKSTNLQEWISTTLDNGGYYIARYEASKNGDKAASKVSIGTATSSSKITDGILWNCITQPNAAIASKAMYPNTTGAKYYSDLINSYAWDTAIIFIQAYSGYTDYISQNGYKINPQLANTGTNADKRCNIQDMAGNTREWTTETSTYSERHITRRGGYYYSSTNNFASYRDYYSNGTSSNSYNSFRTTLYVK